MIRVASRPRGEQRLRPRASLPPAHPPVVLLDHAGLDRASNVVLPEPGTAQTAEERAFLVGLEMAAADVQRFGQSLTLDVALGAQGLGPRLDPQDLVASERAFAAAEPDPLDLAFSTFYLNRTNRSGIITGGVIGGKKQTGNWKIDARCNTKDLVRLIDRIGRWSSRIEVYNLDGSDFLRTVVPTLPSTTLVYLDPPYYVKGQEMLYANCYGPDDHAEVAGLIRRTTRPWVVSYDDHADVRALYEGCQTVAYACEAK
jgi:hypothetical protein